VFGRLGMANWLMDLFSNSDMLLWTYVLLILGLTLEIWDECKL
jgi:hypothetical protein